MGLADCLLPPGRPSAASAHAIFAPETHCGSDTHGDKKGVEEDGRGDSDYDDDDAVIV